ncbi:membrane protein A21 [Aotine betaherpesvirus 1]|uniref:Membrane protein A21 n=1 Tax=Aotine betaherpesvirus 1 TaxID=50290 RepID=G8XUH7_9BETA|nr:membrane protein A21 [Aotine betaherpesvirus 1]AEV80807.1 membrane protein A21 [Aotine betaherpesvirus 1]
MLWILVVLTTARSTCKPDEYSTNNGECCPRCSPGYTVKTECSELTGTVCEPCPNGTYSLNGQLNCTACQTCKRTGMIVIKNCSTTHDALCACTTGYNCSQYINSSCTECVSNRYTSPQPGKIILGTSTTPPTYDKSTKNQVSGSKTASTVLWTTLVIVIVIIVICLGYRRQIHALVEDLLTSHGRIGTCRGHPGDGHAGVCC